jgi:hypothetical protein
MKSDSLVSIRVQVSSQTPQDAPDLSAQTPQVTARRLYKHEDSESVFGMISLTSSVDMSIDDRAFRLYTVIRACSWKQPFCAAYHEFADAFNCSERWIIRSVRKLEQVGYIRIKRKHNKRNEYSTEFTGKKGHVVHFGSNQQLTEGKKTQVAHSVECVQCRLPRKRIGFSGVCMVCVRRSNAKKAADRFLAVHPEATNEELYVALKVRKAKEFQALLQTLGRASA